MTEMVQMQVSHFDSPLLLSGNMNAVTCNSFAACDGQVESAGLFSPFRKVNKESASVETSACPSNGAAVLSGVDLLQHLLDYPLVQEWSILDSSRRQCMLRPQSRVCTTQVWSTGQRSQLSVLLSQGLADLGYVGGGMPTTDEEAKAFAANVADPVKHLNDRNGANAGQSF